MPLTPVSWLGDSPVNTYTTGTQNRPRSIVLANGNILVCWNDFDNGGTENAPTGIDIIGRIFDPLGNPVTGEFRLNITSSTQDEQDAEVVALANGGFMLVYERNQVTNNDIFFEIYNAAGIRITGGKAFDDGFDGDVPNSPVLAVNGDIVQIGWISDNVDGSESVVFRSYNITTDTFGTVVTYGGFGTGVDDDITGLTIAAMTTSTNFAVTFVNRNAGNDQIVLQVVDAAATVVSSLSIAAGQEASDARIAVLGNGNIVVVWQNDTTDTISMAVYSASLTQIFAPAVITGGTTNEPAIAALADGSFVVVWDDDANNGVFGQRFDASGNAIGTNFGIDNAGAMSDPNVIGLPDGRFQVTWVETQNVRHRIFDVRDAPNSTGLYTPNQWVVGTVGDDVFTAAANAEFIHGWAGNDIITEATGSFAQIFGDAGNDTIIVTSAIGGDGFDGGTGNDTIDWSAVNEVGATFRLATGTVTSASSVVEQMVGFENFIGTQNRDIVFGTNSGGTLRGNGGNDDILGGSASDDIYGGTGNDLLLGLGGVDRLYGEDGDDWLDATTGSEIHGGAGYDTLGVFDTVGPHSVISGMEAIFLTGTNGIGSFTITGTQLFGGFAVDTAVSGTGTLTVNMDPGVYLFTTSMTFSSGIALVVNGTSGQDIIKMGNSVNTINAGDTADQIRGGNLVDTINGGGGGDKIMGRGGADVITGGLGDDRFRYIDNADSGFGAARDRITDFNSGQDLIDFSWFDGDAVTAGDQAFTFVGTAAFTNTGIGQLRYTTSGGDILLQADTNGDGVADMEIILQGVGASTLTAADFIL